MEILLFVHRFGKAWKCGLIVFIVNLIFLQNAEYKFFNSELYRHWTYIINYDSQWSRISRGSPKFGPQTVRLNIFMNEKSKITVLTNILKYFGIFCNFLTIDFWELWEYQQCWTIALKKFFEKFFEKQYFSIISTFQ